MLYTQSYENLIKSERQFQAVIGISPASFEYLNKYFKQNIESYIEKFTIAGTVRQKKALQRKDSVLSKSEDKLCFILSYLKNNPLQETQASNWGMNQPQCNSWIHFLLNRLLATLEEMRLVPASDAESLVKLLKTVERVYLDGTERVIQRPLHQSEQKWHYSGKKKDIQ